jgi:hypothetical protein
VSKLQRRTGCETGLLRAMRDRVEGAFSLPALASLPAEDQEFLLNFVKASGSLKEMARILGLSYPTVRNRLDAIIAQLKQHEPTTKKRGEG